jgi:hypothetical protein
MGGLAGQTKKRAWFGSPDTPQLQDKIHRWQPVNRCPEKSPVPNRAFGMLRSPDWHLGAVLPACYARFRSWLCEPAFRRVCYYLMTTSLCGKVRCVALCVWIPGKKSADHQNFSYVNEK